MVIIALVSACILTGCGSSGTTTGSTVSTSTAVSDSATSAASSTTPATVAVAASATLVPTATPSPTPAPSPSPVTQNLQVIASGFGQNDNGQIGYAFIVKNPNSALGISNSQYQVAAYDSSGTVLKTDSNYINIIRPGETFGVGGQLFLDKGQKAAKIEVQVSTGTTGAMTDTTDLTTDKATYSADGYGDEQVSGVVNNPWKVDVKEVRVSAVTYDASGKINGGGFTFVDFVPAGGHAAATVQVTTSGKPAKVELYAVLTSLSNP
ncbi:MAG TPA: hypothetical protein VKU87_04340 [Thermomicrobiaceae bacterium]|nr:hypothetical protein [Thermomicrobiaceae bacterium]